jgi:hypothetical protein
MSSRLERPLTTCRAEDVCRIIEDARRAWQARILFMLRAIEGAAKTLSSESKISYVNRPFRYTKKGSSGIPACQKKPRDVDFNPGDWR